MIHRIDVRLSSDTDPFGEAVRQQIREFGSDVGPITTRRIFLLDSEADKQQVRRIADADVTELELVFVSRFKSLRNVRVEMDRLDHAIGENL